MRSRTSFSKLFRELFSKQLWVFALSCFGYFMVGPVLFLMRIGEWEQNGMSGIDLTISDMTDMFLHMVRADGLGGNLLLPFVLGTMALGIVAAWNGFYWLHGRDKVDLYHSLPVKRQKLFLIQVLICLVDYVVPALLWLALSCVVAGVNGLFNWQIFTALAADWLLGLIFCMYSFSIAALAMMLTGRILVGMLGTAAFFFLDIFVALINLGYQETFFVTKYGTREELFSKIGPVVLSPLHIAVRAFWSRYSGNGWQLALTAAVAALVIGALALFIYLKRPSEAAGKSMAFFKTGECIKLVLSILAALGFGLFFGEATGARTDFWMVFGLILGFLFIYAVIQMIYTMDIRKCLSGKVLLIAGLVITFGIAAFYRFDLGGYDTYLPAKDKIDTVSISVDSRVTGMYDSNMYDDVRMAHAQMQCDDELYAVLQRFISGSQILHKTEAEYADDTYVYKRVIVRLKDGRSYQRQYGFYMKDAEKELLSLYNRKEYKEAVWPMLAIEPEQLLGMKVTCNREVMDDDTYYETGSDSKWYQERAQTVMEKEEGYRILAALQEDLNTRDPDVFLRELPFAQISCKMDLTDAGFGERPSWPDDNSDVWADSKADIWTATIPVYPSFERTGEVLKDLGIEPLQTPDAGDVTKIGFYSDDMYEETVITDPEQISQMLENVTLNCSIPNTYGSSVSDWTDFGQMVTLYLKENDGKEMTCTGWLRSENKDVLVLSDRLEENREAVTEGLTELLTERP